MLNSRDIWDFQSPGHYNRASPAPGQQKFSTGGPSPSEKNMCPAPILAAGFMEFSPKIQSRPGADLWCVAQKFFDLCNIY